MNSNSELIPVNPATPPASHGGAIVPNPQPPVRFDPYVAARRALRGRYLLVLLLGLAGGLVGAVLGWSRGSALYRSEGLIRIAYSRPTVMEQASQYIPLEVYQAFMQSQQALLSSRRLVDMALETPVWAATNHGTSPTVVAHFADNMKVEYRPQTDYLRVWFTDRDPAIAAAAVKSIISAYVQLYSRQDDQMQQQRLQALEERRQTLMATLGDLRKQVEGITREVGPADIDRMQEAVVARVATLQSMLTDIGLALVLAQGQKASSLSVNEIAMIDPVMREYLVQQNRAEDQIEQLRLRGFGEKHQQMIQARAALDTVNERIAKHAEVFSRLQTSLPRGFRSAEGGSSPLAVGGQSLESLRAQEAAVRGMYEQAKQDMLTLGERRVQLQSLKAQAAQAEKELAEVSQRYDMLRVESSIGGMLNVISAGETPLAPFQDRRLPMAAIGGMVGAGLPTGLILLLGLISNRYRYSDETEADLSAQTPLLGILPMLPEGLNDPDRAADAAQCVHQIRAMLQIADPHTASSVYLLTSASPGEGKTSLTAALGLSFAASGSRTLVIDCDLVGQGLSTGFEGEKSTGVREAIESGQLQPFVKPSVHKGLWILPVGRTEAFDATALSWLALKRLLAEARKEFDVVLVDSGPILGSVEASLLAPLVDGVMFVIARGQQRSYVDKGMRQLHAIGAKAAGIVFNRAEPADFYHSVQMTSFRSLSSRNDWSGAAKLEEPSPFGPVVRSVASFLPPRKEADQRRS